MRTVNARKARKIRKSRRIVERFIHSPTIGRERVSPGLFSARKSFSSIRSERASRHDSSALVRPGIKPGPYRQYHMDQNKKQSCPRPPATTKYSLTPPAGHKLSLPVKADQILHKVMGRKDTVPFDRAL